MTLDAGVANEVHWWNLKASDGIDSKRGRIKMESDCVLTVTSRIRS
jgi:hypothetical protein